MTQLDSIMEDKQRTPVKTDSCRRRDSGEGPNNNVPSNRKLEKEKLKDFRTKIPSPLVQRASSKTIKVYRNGEPNHPAENVSLCLERGREWSDVLLDISNAILFPGDVRNIYSMTGVQIMSTSQLVEDHEYVVSAGEAFKPYSYHRRAVPSTIESATTIQATKVVARPKSGNNRSNRTHRANVTQSVVIEGNAFNMEASCSSGPNSLTKTFSEHDVSSMPSSVYSPRSKATISSRKNFSPKPRPASAYRSNSPSSSGNFLEKRSPVVSSRIPKRISNAAIGDNSPTVKSSYTTTTTSSTAAVGMTKSAVVCRAKKADKPTPDKRMSRDVLIQPSRREREFVRPRLVTIIRSGMKPRKASRFLLNKKTAHSFDQVLNDMTESIKPDWGAVRKVYTLNGKEVTALEDFFKDDDVFVACPNDKVTMEDFDLDSEECKSVQPFVKASLMSSQTRKVRATENASRSPQRRPKSSTSPATTAEAANSNHLSHHKSIPLDHFPPPILEKYDVGNIIGDGNFAVVRECIDLTTRKRYAMKVIDKSKCYGRDVPPEHEVIILSSVHHPNIILLYEQYDFSNELYVIMELVPGGDLFDAIAEATKFSEDVSRHMTRDVASALSYLHSHNIVHRDIKPENLLVAVVEGGRRRIKLGDFGLAQIVRGPMYVVCGTPTYVAPEILAETGYGMKVDVWALGVILYVLLCGYPPFVSTTGEQEDLFDMILSGAYDFPPEHWDEISDDAKDIVTRMIESDVDMRLSAEEVLDHFWLAINKEDREQKRKRFFRRDFRFSVFEAMGLTDLPVTNGGQMSLN